MVPTIQPQLLDARLELNLPGQGLYAPYQRPRPKTASVYFAELFPEAAKQYGCPFVEVRDSSMDGGSIVTPVSINTDFFAAALGGDRKLGHSVVYYEPEMAWYYMEPLLQLYKPTTAEKLQNLYRGLLMRAAQELSNEVNKLSLTVEFRSDKYSKAVVQRAKSILAADASFFSADSEHQRIKGPELFERIMRVLCETMLERCQDGCLTVSQAYRAFCRLAEQHRLGSMKQSEFRVTMQDLMKAEFGLSLRRDVPDERGKHQRAWKGIRLIESNLVPA